MATPNEEDVDLVEEEPEVAEKERFSRALAGLGRASHRNGWWAGTIFCLILAFLGFSIVGQLVAGLLSYLPYPFGISPYNIFPWVFAFLGILLGLTGYIEIKVGFKGQPFIFKRIVKGENDQELAFVNGPAWWFPPWMGGSVEQVNVQLQTMKLPIEEGKNPTKDGVNMDLHASLRYRIVNLVKHFEATDNPEETLRIESVKTVRDLISEKLAKDFYTHDGKGDTSTIRKDLVDKFKESEVMKNSEAWGFEIDCLVVTGIDPPEEIMQANAQKNVEEAQARSEKVELDAFLRRVERIKKKNPHLSEAEAVEYAFTQMGKAQLRVQRIRGDAPDMVKAGALAGDANKGG